MKTNRLPILSVGILMLFGVTPAMAVEQCFDQAGTYGNLVVTESGSGCGTIIGSTLHLGNENADESCEFTFTPTIDGSSITVEMIALNELYPTYAEEIIIGMNAAQVDFLGGGDLISGGLKPSTGGVEAPTIGGITEGISDNGLVKFSNAPASVTSLNLQYNWIIGLPNGVLIQVCADDAGVGPATYTVGGTVSGLTGAGLELQNNGADTLPVAADGPFAFVTELEDGVAYAVAVSTQPIGQTCSVTNDSGTIAAADVTDVDVNCVDVAPATPVPTMSEWALIMLSMLLGLMVFANRRRLF